ncbi:MAG: hypothetical protein GY757_59485, partial [bacterium]|nr:hypothetical protein [bacterium]
MKRKGFFITTIIMVLAVLLMGTAQLTAKSEQYPVAEVTVSSNGIYFYPVVPHNSMIVAVSK